MRWRCKSTVSGQMLTVFFVRSLPSRYFDDVQVCNLSADNLEDDADDDIGWKLQQFHGKWVKDVNAGGCINFQGTAAATVVVKCYLLIMLQSSLRQSVISQES